MYNVQFKNNVLYCNCIILMCNQLNVAATKGG